MVGQRVRIAVVGLTFMSLGASPAHAFHHWFKKGCCGAAPATAYYAPVAPAPCATCAPACPQVVNYMPQTCYRTVYVNTPVVAYQPVTSCNPCNGCPTTVMRPVTTYVTQAQVVPYTSYRPVVANYAPACNSCAAAPAVTAAYAPAMVAPAPVAPAPAPAPCCQASYTPPAVGAPAVVRSMIQQPMPSVSAPMQAAPQYQPSAPAGSAPIQSAPNPTFRDQPSNGAPESRVVDPQSSMSPSSLGAPRALDSEDQDRTTYRPVGQTLAAKTVSTTSSISSTTHLTDDSGWRSSR
jgi:hypothetical protein